MNAAIMLIISALVGGTCVGLLIWFMRRLKAIEDGIYGEGHHVSLGQHLAARAREVRVFFRRS